MKNVGRIMLDLIASVFDERACARLPKAISDDELKIIYAISSKHDVAHIVAEGLTHSGLMPANEIGKAFDRQRLAAIFRREQMNTEESRICALLDEGGIDYIPLKGAVIRYLYPEEWLRQSCDIDILVREADLEGAITLISNKLRYSDGGRNYHEHSFISGNGVHLELHFSITENDPESDAMLEKVWEYAVSDGGRRHTLTNEFLMMQMITHAKYHFAAGGCGIRQVLDLWILGKRLAVDKEAFEKMIAVSRADKFQDGVNQLISVWFEGAEHTNLTSDMERYILSGGAFGTFGNKSLAGQHKSGSRRKYLISRIFMPKSELEIAYPRLKEKPILLPYYEAKRWLGLINKRSLSNAKGEMSAKNENAFGDMFNRLGL